MRTREIPLRWQRYFRWGVLLYCAAVLDPNCDPSVDRAWGQPAPAVESPISGRLTQHVYRNRRQQIILKRGLDALTAGRVSEGLTLLQRLLTQGEDGFLWNNDTKRLTSIRQEVIDRFNQFTPVESKSYQRLFGDDANLLWQQANRSRDVKLYHEICQKYLHTPTGFLAANRLATQWLDQGYPLQAARLWDHLARISAHRNRIDDLIRLKAVIAWQAAGDEQKASEWQRTLSGERTLALGGKTMTIDAWLKQLGARRADREAVDSDARSLRSQQSIASAPYWIPQWRHPFRIWGTPLGESLFSRWEQDQTDGMTPLSVCNFPLAVHDAIFVRSPSGILAIEKNSGRPLWEFPAESSLSRTLGETEAGSERPRMGSPRQNPEAMPPRFRVRGGRDPKGEPQKRISTPSLQAGLLNHAYANNALMGSLTSYGERLYAIDGTILTPFRYKASGAANPQPIEDAQLAEIERRGINRLIALPLTASVSATRGIKPTKSSNDRSSASSDQTVPGGSEPMATVQPLWSIGGQLREAADKDPYAGHFFLGPPLAVNGMLYVMAEVDRQINLLALSAKTGDLIWSQGLCFVDRPIGIDTRRALQSLTPIHSQGILICPTLMQSVVAVEAHSGSLLWAASLSDAAYEFENSRWPNAVGYNASANPFAETLLVEGNRILYLPHDSESIHCLELASGRSLWKAAVEDTDYLAAIDAGTLLAVGRRYSRGLSLASGEELWTTWLGTPSGQGVQIGKTYLVPLERGRIANLDIASGKEIGVSREEAYQMSPEGAIGVGSRWRPGNLVADGEHVISVGLRDVTSFPQAAARLKQVHQQLVTQKKTVELELLTAELELTLGHFPEARKRLVRLLNQEQAVASYKPRIESSLRALLYAELKEEREDRNVLLAQLSVLSLTPEERARYLTFKAETDLQQQDLEGVLQSCAEFAELELPDLIPDSENPEHWISAESWVPGMIERVQQQINSSDSDHLRAYVDELQQSVLASGDVQLLERFLMVYSQWPQASSVRLALAKLYLERGEFQKGELHLLPVRESGLPVVAAEATRLQYEIWKAAGLTHEAVELLDELSSRYGDVSLSDGSTGKRFAQQAARGPLAELMRDRKPLSWPVHRVEIRGSRNPLVMVNPGPARDFAGSGPALRTAYEKYMRRLSTPSDSSFYLLEKGKEPGSKLAVINKHLGLIVGEIGVDPPYQYSTIVSNGHVGHFFPLGAVGRAHGISLLEYETGKPFWTANFTAHIDRHEMLRVGPVTPGCCIFQTRQSTLVAVQPSTGKILWLRSDLLLTSGLTIDSSAGIIGDDRVLVVFHADRSHYTIYETQTGKIVRQGQLDVDSSQPRTVIGRKLLYFTSSRPKQELRIWDPLTDAFELRERVLAFSMLNSEKELLLITAEHQLKIIDVGTGNVLLSMQLSPKQLANLSYLRAFRDRDRYYINFQEAVRFVESTRSSYYASDTFLPADHVQGTLWCVDAKSGELLWQRTLPQRSILRIDQYQLPFLVLMSRERGQTDGTKQSLAIEVVDSQTGLTIGHCNNLFPDKMVQLQYDRDAGRLVLQGLKSDVEILFDKSRQRVVADDGPL
ncbi:MAG: PQQ-binding-like beta-propeller repeat protein [Planctomycetaceae bacterium]